jgi:hypothetical protein
MFMNTNSLPVALMQSLVLSIPGLRWGEDDTKGAMSGRAFTYLVLYSSLSMMVRLVPIHTRRLLIPIRSTATMELGCTASLGC